MQFSDLFQFDKFVAPVLIKFVYWIGLLLIAIVTLMGVLGMGSMYRYGYGMDASIGNAILALIIGVVWALVWRILCEVWIVIFSINDRLGIIAGQKKD